MVVFGWSVESKYNFIVYYLPLLMIFFFVKKKKICDFKVLNKQK